MNIHNKPEPANLNSPQKYAAINPTIKNKNEYLLPYLGISLSQNNFFSGEEFMYGENQNFQNYPYIETQVKSPIYPKEQYKNIYNNMIGYNDYDYLLNNTIKRNRS